MNCKGGGQTLITEGGMIVYLNTPVKSIAVD